MKPWTLDSKYSGAIRVYPARKPYTTERQVVQIAVIAPSAADLARAAVDGGEPMRSRTLSAVFDEDDLRQLIDRLSAELHVIQRTREDKRS